MKRRSNSAKKQLSIIHNTDQVDHLVNPREGKYD